MPDEELLEDELDDELDEDELEELDDDEELELLDEELELLLLELLPDEDVPPAPPQLTNAWLIARIKSPGSIFAAVPTFTFNIYFLNPNKINFYPGNIFAF